MLMDTPKQKPKIEKVDMFRQILILKNKRCIHSSVFNKWVQRLILVLLVTCSLLICQEMLRLAYLLTTADPIALGKDAAFAAQQKYNRIRFRKGEGYRSLPHCIIIGVRKAGTKALHEFLDMHPNVATAKHETHFFDNNARYSQGINFYLDLMPNSNLDQIVIEKTPRYFITPYVPKRIKLMNETVKLILIVRDPVHRMISEYVHFDVLKGHNVTFESLALLPNGEINEDYSPLRNSKYYYNLKHWLKYFPREQLHIVDGQQLITNPFKEIVKVEAFLGLPHKITKDRFYFDKTKGYYCRQTRKKSIQCLGEAKGRSHPAVDPFVLLQLSEYFKPYNEMFFDLAEVDFDW